MGWLGLWRDNWVTFGSVSQWAEQSCSKCLSASFRDPGAKDKAPYFHFLGVSLCCHWSLWVSSCWGQPWRLLGQRREMSQRTLCRCNWAASVLHRCVGSPCVRSCHLSSLPFQLPPLYAVPISAFLF